MNENVILSPTKENRKALISSYFPASLYQGIIYVEAKVSGKTARGFIQAASLGLE